MNKKGLVLSTGFALFSMFFGSGNLVFPITVGQESGGHYLLAALGIFLTGVVVPFLGVLGMMLYQGNIQEFFSSFGKKGIFIFSFLALALMGPFGVLARCLTVAHGALLLLFPTVSLPLASLLMCVVIYFLSINKHRIVSLLGTFLTPFLLVAIAAIAFFGLKQRAIPEITSFEQWGAFKNGFFQGYQTMDLLAAFFFSQFIIKYLHNCSSTSGKIQNTMQVFYKASFVGAGLLAGVYFVLVMLGWIYSPLLVGQPPQEMLGLIAMQSLGDLAAPCLCLAIIFACLTTAIVLTSLFAEFLRHEVTQNKLTPSLSLLITLGIGFFVSTLEFAGIAKFLGPLLEMVYPALITLTVMNIGCKFLQVKSSHWPFTLTIIAKMCTI